MDDDSSLHLSDPLPFPRHFQSKVDWWLAVALVAPLFVPVGLLMSGIMSPWVLAAALVPAILTTWILGRTHYSVDETAIVARCGPFRMTLPVASLRSLSPTRNPLSSPALSLDRIAIEHTGGRLMVSPRNKPGFVRAVLAVAPGVSVTGLPGTRAADPDVPESAFNAAAIIPIVLLTVGALAFGSWQLYSGTRPPGARVEGDTLSITGLYSMTLNRRDVVRMALQPDVTITRKVSGLDGGRYVRGLFEVEGLGVCRLYLTRGSSPVLVIHTRTQPIAIALEDPAATRALEAELRVAWQMMR